LKFRGTGLAGVFVIEPEPIRDDRGYFARIWSQEDFAREGIEVSWAQGNLGYSERSGTLRGMHFQLPPHEEAKLVWCPQGELYDVVVDLRPDSATRYQWVGVELTAENRLMCYLPPGCAHGYQTLAHATELFYLTSHRYEPASATGVRWDDPVLDIRWPRKVEVISEQDRGWPLLANGEVAP
jgi:dTDP-4-dehydrorhamnose 3,5-epimerase